jgi:hypothetical protein
MPDGLISVTDLREIFDISADIKTGRLERHLVAAGRTMRTWVGDDAYDDALLPVPTDATRKEALELAEAHLAMRFAILGINTALRARGIVKQERSGQGDVIVTYHTPGEMEKLKEEFFNTAHDLAGAYLLPASDEPESFGAVVGGSDSSCEAVTRTRCG